MHAESAMPATQNKVPITFLGFVVCGLESLKTGALDTLVAHAPFSRLGAWKGHVESSTIDMLSVPCLPHEAGFGSAFCWVHFYRLGFGNAKHSSIGCFCRVGTGDAPVNRWIGSVDFSLVRAWMSMQSCSHGFSGQWMH